MKKNENSYDRQQLNNQEKPRIFNPYDNSGINMKTMETITNVGMSMGRGVLENQGINLNDIFSLKFLKPYFSIDNKYVSKKLRLVLFPYFYNEATLNEEIESEQYNEGDQKPGITRNSIAFPDLYVPLMGFITFLLVVALSLGTDNQYNIITNRFHPDLLGYNAGKNMIVLFLQMIVLKTVFYVFYNSNLSVLDLMAYVSYKFVLLTILMVTWILASKNKSLYWVLLVYCCVASMSFMNQVLRNRLPKDENNEVTMNKKLVIRIISLSEILSILLILV